MGRPTISKEQKVADGKRLARIFARAQEKDRSLTQESLAAEMGVTQGLFGQWLSGKTAIPDKRLMWLAARLEFSAAEFRPELSGLLGMASIQFEPMRTVGYGVSIEPGPEIRGLLPLISWVQAGNWAESPDMYEVGDAEKWMPCPVAHGHRSFILRVVGPSMDDGTANGYRDGELIYVDPDALTKHNDDVIIKNGSGEATFKRLVCQGERCHLVPLNKNWPDQVIPLDEHCTIVGKVIFSGKER